MTPTASSLAAFAAVTALHGGTNDWHLDGIAIAKVGDDWDNTPRFLIVVGIAAVRGRLHVAGWAVSGVLVSRQGRNDSGEDDKSLENLEHFGGDEEDWRIQDVLWVYCGLDDIVDVDTDHN